MGVRRTGRSGRPRAAAGYMAVHHPYRAVTMATTGHRALDTFVDATREAFRTHEDQRQQAQAVSAAAEDLVAVDGWMDELIDFDGRRARAELHLDEEYGHPAPGFVVKGSVTHPDESTGGSTPHDHGAAWVAYAVYRGRMEQYRYGWEYDEDARNPELTERDSFVQEPGDARFFLPGEIHRTNIVSEGPTWVVRIESQHTGSVDRHRYDPDGNGVRPH